MQFRPDLTAAREKLRRGAEILFNNSGMLGLAFGAAVMSMGLAEAAQHAGIFTNLRFVLPDTVAEFTSGPAPAVTVAPHTVWVGADLDGDGQPDIADPTGQAPRQTDAYGEGCFHAARDGGSRRHEGVDYVATPGQTVVAPISGFVTKIGNAYAGDQTLRFVEIENPALHITARAFYVDPTVELGQAIAIGRPIGVAHTLQRRYPLGITDHIHLEIDDGRGRKLDAERLITARVEGGAVAAQ